MKIEILYKDRFENSGQLLIDKLTKQEKYELIDFSDVLRRHINSESELGLKLQSYLNKGQLIPAELTNEIMTTEINQIQTDKVLLKNYPKSKEQIELFIEFCKEKKIELKRAWHMVSLNVLANLEKIPKHSKMAAKYKSHEYIEMNHERSNKANSESIQEIANYCETITFESESYGVNIENDKIRISNHT